MIESGVRERAPANTQPGTPNNNETTFKFRKHSQPDSSSCNSLTNKSKEVNEPKIDPPSSMKPEPPRNSEVSVVLSKYKNLSQSQMQVEVDAQMNVSGTRNFERI